jgi:type II secretory pathway pseudopilin PulG
VRSSPVTPRAHPEGERGFSLVIVLGGITVMMILLGAAVPTWRYIMQDDREQELFFRGDQIARAVEEYQRKNGNAFPPSFEVLVKGKFLRREYKDPMVKGGKWRIVRPGEAVAATPTTSGTGARTGSTTTTTTTIPSAFGPPGGTSVGVIAGVVSTSHDNSLRLFNGRTRYDQWIFLAGQPRLLGKNKGPNVPGGGIGVGASPGSGQRPASAAPLR